MRLISFHSLPTVISNIPTNCSSVLKYFTFCSTLVKSLGLYDADDNMPIGLCLVYTVYVR